MSWLFALRLGRWGIAGFSVLAFVITLANTFAFYAIAGSTEAERQAFGTAITTLAVQFSVLVPPPLRPDTVGGYVQFRAYGALAILMSIWAVVSAAGSTRADEERGIVEGVLATGVSRADALVARVGAFAGGTALACGAAALGLATGVAHAGDRIDAASVLGATIDLAAITICVYALAALICQFCAPRLATAGAGVVILALFLVNSLGRSIDFFQRWQWISPFHYFDQSQPLPPGGPFDVRAVEVLFAIAAVAAVAAMFAFANRDVGSPLFRLPTRLRHPSHDPGGAVWRVPVLRGLWDRRVGLAVWVVGMAAIAALFTALTKAIVQPLLQLQTLKPFFNLVIQGDLYPSFLGYVWFSVAQLLVAGYAIVQVARWSAEDVDGRLELALANPYSRLSAVLERALVATLGAIAIVLISAAAVGLEAQRESINVAASRLVVASAVLVPFATFFMALGAVLAAMAPRAAVGVLAAFAIAGYFIIQLVPIFKWPSWLLDLSPFHLYGQPLANGVDGTGLAIMLMVTVVGFVASALLMNRRDVGA
jgi:ABC-2 type transport system permease protein